MQTSIFVLHGVPNFDVLLTHLTSHVYIKRQDLKSRSIYFTKNQSSVLESGGRFNLICAVVAAAGSRSSSPQEGAAAP